MEHKGVSTFLETEVFFLLIFSRCVQIYKSDCYDCSNNRNKLWFRSKTVSQRKREPGLIKFWIVKTLYILKKNIYILLCEATKTVFCFHLLQPYKFYAYFVYVIIYNSVPQLAVNQDLFGVCMYCI